MTKVVTFTAVTLAETRALPVLYCTLYRCRYGGLWAEDGKSQKCKKNTEVLLASQDVASTLLELYSEYKSTTGLHHLLGHLLHRCRRRRLEDKTR